MIQIHGNTILSIGFNPIIKAHDSNPWQIIYQKPNIHWQHQNLNSHCNIKSLVFAGNIKKPSSHWQYQNT